MSVSRAKQTVVIGAGPYGLATAAHLAAAGVSVRTFGEPMESWERHMPEGMLLRSRWQATHIANPDRLLSLDHFREERKMERSDPIPLALFTEYGRWFQERAVPRLERRRVERLGLSGRGMVVELDDGERLEADRVVVAAGIVPFAWRPPQFNSLPPEVASHTVDHPSLGVFRGRRVAVVGAGQSALESAALLGESGGDVQLIGRTESIRWLGEHYGDDHLPFTLYAYARTGVGDAKSSWLVARPELFRRLPRPIRQLGYRWIRPAGASWLKSRLEEVEITLGRSVRSAVRRNGVVELDLDDGTKAEADHVLLATGYRVDLARYRFLDEDLLRRIRTREGQPILGAGLESSVPGLHFVGASAADTFGPLMRFVCGTWAAARAVTRNIVGPSAPRTGFSW